MQEVKYYKPVARDDIYYEVSDEKINVIWFLRDMSWAWSGNDLILDYDQLIEITEDYILKSKLLGRWI